MSSTNIVTRSRWLLAFGILALYVGNRPAYSQSTRAETPYIVEWVYQVNWGYFDDWYTLFKKYQIPILDKEKEEGIVTKYIVQRGGGHQLGEDTRWDLRVLIYYKSREAQAGASGTAQKLFPDQETYRKEEQQRWRLTKAHWDRPLTEVDPHVGTAASLTGLWNATIDVNGTEIPFKIEFSGDGSTIKGWFFNGVDHENSTGGKFENGSLVLNFDTYASVLKAALKDGALDGEYSTRGKPLPIHAVRAVSQPPSKVQTPDISGLWYLENVASSKKGEKAWQFIVRQQGAEVSGAILRVDGDTGTLTGSYKDGKFVLSHFSGGRPALLVIAPQDDGTLTVDLKGQHHEGVITAVRPEQARAKGLPEPTDANLHTGVKDPTRPFNFSFFDLNGKIVSNTDERFRGKVLLINVTGSWCPNCHDEDQFLPAIYKKYRDRGLEIVALDFEEPEQLADPTRLKALIKEYGIEYTVLLGGETSTAKEKLTQARDWDSWPTTFFVGRDGLVKAVHSGFPSPGSGELYQKEKEEFTAEVETLLAGDQRTSR
jgi:thiol-disulfide isomerase/thioredoxin